MESSRGSRMILGPRAASCCVGKTARCWKSAARKKSGWRESLKLFLTHDAVVVVDAFHVGLAGVLPFLIEAGALAIIEFGLGKFLAVGMPFLHRAVELAVLTWVFG